MNPRRPEGEINGTIAKILRYGVVLSSAVVATGLALMLLVPPAGVPETLQGMLRVDYGGPTLSLSALVGGIAVANPISILQLGTLILIATPITRVAASVVLFFKERDMLYVGITLLVLSMLLFAIFVIGPIEA